MGGEARRSGGRLGGLGRALLRPACLSPAPPDPRSSVPRLGRPERAASSAACGRPAPSFLLPSSLSFSSLLRHRTRSRRAGADAAGSQGRAQPALPPPAPAPPAASPPSSSPPPLLLRFSLLLLPSPSCQHHVRRGRFWKPTEKFKLVFLGEQSGKYPAYSPGLVEPTPAAKSSTHWDPDLGSKRPLGARVEKRFGDGEVVAGSEGPAGRLQA